MKLRIPSVLAVTSALRLFVKAYLLAVVAIGSAHATPDTVGYRLTIQRANLFNVPFFTLVNPSSDGIEITAFDFGIS